MVNHMIQDKLDAREGVWHVIEADPEASRQETSRTNEGNRHEEEKQETENEKARADDNNPTITDYAKGKHASEKIRELELRRARRLKKKRKERKRVLEIQARDGQGKSKHTTDDRTKYDRIVDVICIDERGEPKTVTAKEYKDRTQHRASESAHRHRWRHSQRKRSRKAT